MTGCATAGAVDGNGSKECADTSEDGSSTNSCRAANRRKESQTYRNSVLGFRVAYGLVRDE